MFRTLGEVFNDNLAFTFRKKAKGVIKQYGNNQRHCRFTVLFDAPLEYPKLAEDMVLQTIDWTISKCKSEYDRRHSDSLKRTIRKMRDDYKELKFNKNLV